MATASAATKRLIKEEEVYNASDDERSKETLKSMIKEKLSRKVQTKQDQEAVQKMYINFPKDKPTYSLELLEK